MRRGLGELAGVGGPPVLTNWPLGVVAATLPQSLGNMALGSLSKTFLACKTGKRIDQDLYLKGAKKEFTIASFLK